MDRLRRQADMAHHGNIHIHDGLDNPGDVDPTFEFDGLGPAFLEQASGIGDRLTNTGLIGEKRHVAHNEGARASPVDQPEVVDHIVHRDRQGRIRPLHGRAQRVADQEKVDAALVQDAGERVVVGGEGGDLLPGRLQPLQFRNRNLRGLHVVPPSTASPWTTVGGRGDREDGVKTTPAFTQAARRHYSLPSSFSAVRLGPYNWIQAVCHHYPFALTEPVWVDRFVARRLPRPRQRHSMGVLLAYLSEDCLGAAGFWYWLN